MTVFLIGLGSLLAGVMGIYFASLNHRRGSTEGRMIMRGAEVDRTIDPKGFVTVRFLNGVVFVMAGVATVFGLFMLFASAVI